MTPKFVVQIEDTLEDFPTRGLNLLLIFQHDVFPHLAILNQGKYWAVSTLRVHRAAPGLAKWNSFKRKKLRVVCFEIFNSSEDEFNIRESFAHVSDLSSSDNTCLRPVLDFFRRKANTEIRAEVVAELLLELRNLKLVKHIGALNISPGILSLPEYSKEDVLSGIALKRSR
ncbi:MAG: hypothetical protein KDC13_06095 [Bacteroidetes bacterium]|nr:hypothetical protein [Bacteroidota bacterium]